MQTVLQKLGMADYIARMNSEGKRAKRQADEAVAETRKHAAAQDAIFAGAIELENLTRREHRLIGYIESVTNNTIVPLVKERANLQVDEELHDQNHSERIAEIDATIKYERAKIKKLSAELAEVQAEILKLAAH